MFGTLLIAPDSISTTVDGIYNSSKEVSLSNNPVSNFLTLLGIVNEVKEVQDWANPDFNMVGEFSSLIEAKEEQESNVAPSIISTLDGMVTEVNDVAWKKAPSPI